MWSGLPLMGLIVASSIAICNKEFCRRASHIRGHLLKIIGRGMASCGAEDSKLKPVVAALSKVEKQRKEKSVHEAEKRQLDKKSAAAAPQEQQEIENSEEEECWSDENLE